MDFSLSLAWKAQRVSHQHVPCREPQKKEPAQPPCWSQLKRGCLVLGFFSLNPFPATEGKTGSKSDSRKLSKTLDHIPSKCTLALLPPSPEGGKAFHSTSLLRTSYPARLELWIKTHVALGSNTDFPKTISTLCQINFRLKQVHVFLFRIKPTCWKAHPHIPSGTSEDCADTLTASLYNMCPIVRKQTATIFTSCLTAYKKHQEATIANSRKVSEVFL